MAITRASPSSWVYRTRFNIQGHLLPPDHQDCFRRALLRLAITINLDTARFARCARWLRYDDAKLLRRCKEESLDTKLYTFREMTNPGKAEREEAEHYFYGMFNIRPVGRRDRWKLVDYTTTDKFLEYSYEGFHAPEYDFSLLAKGKLNEYELLMRCAANYLLKNFWHNYVHTQLQGINYSNYHMFGGTARFESDFEADNLANILLAKSYGLPVETKGFRTAAKKILVMLRRNRCNRVFSIRAARRGQKALSLEEKEWRYCRTLSNYISGWLLAGGRAAAALAVYLKGNVVRRRSGGYTRQKPEIVVEVNGVRIATEEEGLAEKFTAGGAERGEHFRVVAQAVNQRYGVLLRKNAALREYAKNALEGKLRCAGVEC